MSATLLGSSPPGLRSLRRLARRAVSRGLVQPLRRAAPHARAVARSLVRDPDVQHLLSTAAVRAPRVLVIGPARAVRRALPHTLLDVVGTDPQDQEVTVVSEADDEHALPRRWDCVVVTDVGAPGPRLRAGLGACLPGGSLVVLTRRRSQVDLGGDVVVERVLRRRTVALHLARVTA